MRTAEMRHWMSACSICLGHRRQLGGPYQQPTRNFVQLCSEQQEIKSIIYVTRRIKTNFHSTVSPRQPTVPTVVKKFPLFNEFWNFITVLTTASTCLCPQPRPFLPDPLQYYLPIYVYVCQVTCFPQIFISCSACILI